MHRSGHLLPLKQKDRSCHSSISRVGTCTIAQECCTVHRSTLQTALVRQNKNCQVSKPAPTSPIQHAYRMQQRSTHVVGIVFAAKLHKAIALVQAGHPVLGHIHVDCTETQIELETWIEKESRLTHMRWTQTAINGHNLADCFLSAGIKITSSYKSPAKTANRRNRDEELLKKCC
jgi:hypothetical protein